MHVVQGATGHAWSAAAVTLSDRGEDVTVVTRDPAKAAEPVRRRVSHLPAEISGDAIK